MLALQLPIQVEKRDKDSQNQFTWPVPDEYFPRNLNSCIFNCNKVIFATSNFDPNATFKTWPQLPGEETLFVSFSHSSQSQPVLERNCRLVELHTLNGASHNFHLAIEHKISYYWTYCYFQTKLENRISTHEETAHKKLLLLCTVCSFLISKMWDKRHHMVVIHN